MMTPLDGAPRNNEPPREGTGEEKKPAAPLWPPSAVLHPLPPIAEDHDDLRSIKKAVEDAASVSGPLWLSYLFALFYIALAAAGVTHADLLVENPVKLPFLNIELALKAFFCLAPILFVILHAYTLMYFVLLGAKASQFHDRLKEQIPNDQKIREGLRRQLPSNIFVQFLAGPREFRNGAFGWLLKIIAWTTLVIFPMALLLLLQLQFLPYHDSAITWTSRVAILADYLLIGWLWPSILGGRTGFLEGLRWWTGFKPQSAMAFLGLSAVGFSWGVATVPAEWEEAPYTLSVFSRLKAPATASTDWVFGKPGDERDAQAKDWPANTLRLGELNIYEALKTKPDDLKWKAHIVDLQHRHLEYADLSWSKLDNVNLRDARLQGVSLKNAQLQGASLDDARLQGASLENAQLQGASLDDAQLQGASLDGAQLQGASLESAELLGASLFRARLQGASLAFAELQGSSLEQAELQGAYLENTKLQGASLENAQLQGAVLLNTQLQGASLGSVQLKGASLSGPMVWRSDWGSEEGPDLDDVKQIEIDGIDWSPVWINNHGNDGLMVIPWDDQSYGALRQRLEKILKGDDRDAVLERVERLDCQNIEESLASCDPEAKLPPAADVWRKALEKGRARDQAANERARAEVFSDLLCGANANAIYILRGLSVGKVAAGDECLGSEDNDCPGEYSLLAGAGGEAPALIKKILGDKNQCPVSAALTARDRARLLEIKTAMEGNPKAEAESTPPRATEKQPRKQPQPSSAASKRAKASRARSAR